MPLSASLVAIGASAGGVESLQQFVQELPGDLPAALAVVLHVPATSRSLLAGILSRAGPLAATEASDGEAIVAGRIYVARPGRHLLVDDGRFWLGDGPPEHAARPAIDPLFRSAAAAFGPRVIGVVLSGSLTDGTAGLVEVKRQGGRALVEDPETASHPSMPRSAVRHVDVDFVAGCAQLAQEAVRWVRAWDRNGHSAELPTT